LIVPAPSTVEPIDRQKLERRRQILDAAKRVFADMGYHGASINAIIERAQIARGTFYLYYESKAAVFDSILDQATADLRARIHRIEVEDKAAPPPQVQLRAQLVATMEYIVGDRALATLLLKAGHTPDAEAAHRLDQFFADVRGLIVRALETGVEIGLVRKCHPELVAAALLGSVRGVIEVLVDSPAPPPIDDVVGEMIQLSLRGILVT
jgi:AcrR family transcriptional regulator